MRKQLFWTISLVISLTVAVASAQSPAVEFYFQGATVTAPQLGRRVELMPVLRLLGAEAAYSPAAGTYGVVLGDHVIQFAPGRSSILIDGTLNDAGEAPTPSPGGVAASLGYLERWILGPLGYHLEGVGEGYRIAPGARFADPVQVRPIAADFGRTTTLVLELGRSTDAAVDTDPESRLVVSFPDATPQLDTSIPLRSRRVRTIVGSGQQLVVIPEEGVGLVSWHTLSDPARVILELGAVRPTPTPAPVRMVETLGPSPIVIDPGHGGDDTGAVSAQGLKEKELSLAIARRLRAILEARGFRVRLTRDGDEARALSDRTALANRLEAVAFISLHANASTVSAVHGAETYYMSLDSSATDDAAAATADLENRANGSTGGRSPLDLILWDLAQSEVLNESAKLALRVQQHLNSLLGLRDRGVKQAPFAVLTGATMPAVLVEVGFLSNPRESGLLASAEHQQKVAEAIALGVADFVRQQ